MIEKMKTIDIGKEFSDRLVNRNKYQGDGRHNAIKFRSRYLLLLDNDDAWENDSVVCQLDFSNVRKIAPSFANEAFAYFMKFSTPEQFHKKVKLLNTTRVQHTIIDAELRAGRTTDA